MSEKSKTRAAARAAKAAKKQAAKKQAATVKKQAATAKKQAASAPKKKDKGADNEKGSGTNRHPHRRKPEKAQLQVLPERKNHCRRSDCIQLLGQGDGSTMGHPIWVKPQRDICCCRGLVLKLK